MTKQSTKKLTVKELIEKLQQVLDQNLFVYTEGCDCTGDAVDVRIEGSDRDGDKSVCITRS